MDKYECGNCRCTFDEPYEEHTTYESYYGVSSMFPNSHSMTLYLCPNCGSDDIGEIERPEYTPYRGEPLKNYHFKKKHITRL